MKTVFLILYFVTGGQMHTVRLPQPSIEQCETIKSDFAQRTGAMHAECKVKTSKEHTK